MPIRDGAGVPHTALQFPPDLAEHPLLKQGIDLISSFIERPSVAGVAPLVAWDREKATFVYPSRDGLLIAELIARCASEKRPGGIRAALDLLTIVGPVLDEAARAGRLAGLPGHGALNPWRILIHPSGSTSLLGYGVPAVEITAWLESISSRKTREPGAGLRYFAPERIDEQDEDLRADLYALAVSALELAIGRALLASELSPGAIIAAAIRKGAALQAVREAPLPEPIRELFSSALAIDPGDRPVSGKALASRAAALLPQASGQSLLELAFSAPQAPREETPRPSSRSAIPEPNSPRLPAPAAPKSTPPASDPLSTGPVAAPPRAEPIPKRPAPSAHTTGILPSLPPPQPSRILPSAAPWASPGPDEDPDEGDEPTLVDDVFEEPTIVEARPAVPQRGPIEADRSRPSRPPSVPPAPEPRVVWEEEITTPLGSVPLPARAPQDSVPPVEDLPRDASLSLIQRHAIQIVARTERLVRQADALTETLAGSSEASAAQGAALKAAKAAAQRAARASESAKSAAALIELDEDASGALITLDLVRNAELQCESALADVKAQLTEIERAAERAALQERALAEAARLARDHANRSTDAANQADDVVTALESEVTAGALSAEGITAALDDAISAAERADAAAEEARAQADLAATADRAEIANRHAEIARRAEDVASKSLMEARQAADRAKKLESEAQKSAFDKAKERVVAARFAAEESARALARADSALGPSSGDEGPGLAQRSESRSLRIRCAVRVRDSAAAAAEAEAASYRVRDAASSRSAATELDHVLRAVKRCEEASADAIADSERIVALAGEVAQARARLSKLQEEAKLLVERAKSSMELLREDADRLQQDTSGLDGEHIAEARTSALATVQETQQALGETSAALERSASGDADRAEEALAELQKITARVSALAEEARQRISRARIAAEDEIAERRRQEERRRSIDQAAAEARQHAWRCRELVDQAWAAAKGLSLELRTTDLDEAIRYRTKALEIIDIAEFQAGEARSSADLAAAESDPTEARAHAQTALSFLERIKADLPEAIESIDLAESTVRRESELLHGSRSRTAEIASLVEAIGAEISALISSVRTDAARHRSDESVAAQLGVVEQFGVSFNEDLNESGWARDRAQMARTGTDAAELVPHAESALGRAREKKRRLDAAFDTLRRAIGAADAAQIALAEARRDTRSAADAVASDLSRLIAAQQRLTDAIAKHASRDESSSNAELHMRESIGDVRRLQDELRVLTASSDTARNPDEARRLASRAAEIVRTVERAVEIAAETEAKGVAAAEHEARSRAEARKRQVASQREEADRQLQRALELLERMKETLTSIDAEISSSGSTPARARLEEAVRLSAVARSQTPEVEASARAATIAEDNDIERHTERARSGADRIATDVSRALAVAQEALDLARVATAEAAALESVRSEVATTAERADVAVERAKAESVRLTSAMRETSLIDARALSEESSQHIAAATKAAAKVRAAIPLAAQADALAVAQSILRTARLALERADASADAVRALVERVLETARQEREAATRALSDARALAAKPAQDAAAAARKAEGWLETGRREALAEDDDTTRSALRILERAVSEVRRLADEALATAARAESAPTVAAAQASAPEIAAASALAIDASERARAALGGLRDRIAAAKIESDAMASIAAEAAEHAVAASQVAEQGEASLREIELAAEAETPASDDIAKALHWMRTATTNARFAAAQAGQAAERARSSRSRADAEASAEAARSALEDAFIALEKFVEAEQFCRAAIETHREEEAERAKRAETERKRQQEAAVQQQKATAQRQAEQEQQQSFERQRREEERKANVERRREERRTGGTPSLRPANDRESLRSMLRQSRPTIEGPEATSARPRRRGDLAEPSTTQPHAEIRSWAPKSTPPEVTPGAESTGRMTAPKRAGRPSAAKPPSVPPPEPRDEEATQPRDPRTPPPSPLSQSSDSPNVDALLSRLRARRSERD